MLLLTLLLTGTLATMVVSVQASVRLRLAMAQDEIDLLKADLATHSGLEYARRQIALDPFWAGTPDEGILLQDGTSFVVTREDQIAAANATRAKLVVTGRSTLSDSFSLEVILDIFRPPGDDTLGALAGAAFVNFTGNGRLVNTQIVGDVVLADAPNSAERLNMDTGEFEVAPIEGVRTKITRGTIEGTVYNFDSEAPYPSSNGLIQLGTPARVPSVDLDAYMAPGDDRVIFTGGHKYSGLHLDKTAVFVLRRGDGLVLKDVELLGGAVVYSEPDFDYFRESHPERGKIRLEGRVRIGGGSEGVQPTLGLVAPAYKLGTAEKSETLLEGFNFLQRVDTQAKIEVFGQVFIHNKIKNFNNSRVVYRPSLHEGIQGIDFHGGIGAFEGVVINVVAVRESFPDLDAETTVALARLGRDGSGFGSSLGGLPSAEETGTGVIGTGQPAYDGGLTPDWGTDSNPGSSTGLGGSLGPGGPPTNEASGSPGNGTGGSNSRGNGNGRN